MTHTQKHKIDATTLHNTVQRQHRMEQIFALVLLAFTAFAAWYAYQRFVPSIPYSFGMLFSFLLLVYGASMDIPDSKPLAEATDEQLGQYTREELKALVREVTLSFHRRDFLDLYVLDTKEANAMVLNVSGINFVKKWNAIYISPYLLNTLTPKELRAVLSHEIAHFSAYNTLWMRYAYLKPLIFAIWGTFVMSYPVEYLWAKTGSTTVFLIVAAILAWIGVLGWFAVLSNIIAGLVAIPMNRMDSQEIEFLCDYEAAKRHGTLAIINSLLKLGSRTEIYQHMVTRLSPNDDKPLEWDAEPTAPVSYPPLLSLAEAFPQSKKGMDVLGTSPHAIDPLESMANDDGNLVMSQHSEADQKKVIETLEQEHQARHQEENFKRLAAAEATLLHSEATRLRIQAAKLQASAVRSRAEADLLSHQIKESPDDVKSQLSHAIREAERSAKEAEESFTALERAAEKAEEVSAQLAPAEFDAAQHYSESVQRTMEALERSFPTTSSPRHRA